jgi:hypothetical protein
MIHSMFSLFVSLALMFSAVQGTQPIDLGLAAPYAILAGSTVTSTGTVGTVVTGDIGIFPGSAITGFPPAVLNGAVDSANGASGDAQGALTTAYNVAAGKALTMTLSNSDLGGMTLLPGVYKFDETAAMNGMLTLDADGNPNAVWVFQVGSEILIAEGSSVIFKDSLGNPDYVYWQVGTTATLATGVSMVGNILALTSIVVNDGATVLGRCLARNAEVTLDRSVVTMPAAQTFSVMQNIQGISFTQYNQDVDNNHLSLIEAIAASMSGVTVDNIEQFTVEAGPTTTTNARGSFLRKSELAATKVKSINLNYNVRATSTYTSKQLQNQLKAAVEDGTFDANLQTAATNNGAADLQGATSNSITTVTITEGDDDDSSSDKKLSGGAIAGIVIGCVCFALIVAALVAYFLFSVNVFACFTCCGASASAGGGASAAVPTEVL